MALDFVTGLRPSEGNTVILTIVDRFTKMVHYVPLPKLPTALETANLLVKHVFYLHGLPVDIVSDRGPQFISRVWKDFCTAVGAAASLSLGYHLQTNGQTERVKSKPRGGSSVHGRASASLLELVLALDRTQT